MGCSVTQKKPTKSLSKDPISRLLAQNKKLFHDKKFQLLKQSLTCESRHRKFGRCFISVHIPKTSKTKCICQIILLTKLVEKGSLFASYMVSMLFFQEIWCFYCKKAVIFLMSKCINAWTGTDKLNPLAFIHFETKNVSFWTDFL